MHALVTLVIIVAVMIVGFYGVNRLPIRRRAKEILRVVVIVIGVLYLLRALGALTLF